MKPNTNFLNDIKVKHKLYIVYLFCVVTPIIVINYIFYLNMVSNVEEIHQNYYQLTTQRITTLIEKDLNFLISQVNKLYMDQKLYEKLDQDYERKLAYVEDYYDYFNSYLFLNGESYEQIEKMLIYTDNPTILHSGRVYKIDANVKEQYWYRRIINSPERIHIIYGEREDKADNTVETPISVIQVLNQFQGIDRYQKILKTDISIKNISNIINSENLRGNIIILGEEGELLFTSSDIGNQDLSSFLAANQENIVETNLNSYFNWRILNVIDVKDLETALQTSKYGIIMLTLISLSISSIILIMIYRSFYLRLNSLSEHVRSLDQEDFNKQYIGKQGKDEIGDLIRVFNRMVRKIKTLITDVYEAKLEQSQIKLEKKQAELSALQSQINPHFLFNTLESIRMKSLEKGENETAEIIKYLARSFRRIISYHQEMVTVADEIDNIKDFLKIQKYRFGSEFDYILDVESEVLQVLIPKLIIQPFVENACIHGLEKSENSGQVSIRITNEDKKLKCIIKDNGIGIKKEIVEHLLEDIQSDDIKNKSVGMENIYKRLRLYYKDNFKLEIESKEDFGTIVTLIIPMGVI